VDESLREGRIAKILGESDSPVAASPRRSYHVLDPREE
jgi:hypothetical protein